jgi:P-type conjugative transfer protein TrbJ
LMAVPVIAVMLVAVPPQAAAQLTVFDPVNYGQNLLTAARALGQINNQVSQLRNQVLMIQRMDQNLVRLESTISPDLQRALSDIQTQLRAGEGIALRLHTTQSGYEQLFPRQVSTALSPDDVLRNAKSRWDEQYAGLKRTALLQGQIADSVDTDTRLLGDAMARSRSAAGALEVTQAANELTGLSVKQSLALQSLLAAQHRAETLTRARDLATEDEARQRFKSFVGTVQPTQQADDTSGPALIRRQRCERGSTCRCASGANPAPQPGGHLPDPPPFGSFKKKGVRGLLERVRAVARSRSDHPATNNALSDDDFN